MTKWSRMFFFWILFLFTLSANAIAPAKKRVDDLFKILEQAKHQNYIGEPVSQLEHALQCAELAQKSGADDEIVIAALLHDIGHLVGTKHHQKMGDFGVAEHEKVGQEYLASMGFSKKVTDLVEGHVLAKRYLTYKDPKYYDALSDASKETLRFQGGPMNALEAQAFEQAPYFKEKLALRHWDELAKETHWQGPSLNSYRTKVLALLNKTT